MTADRNRQRFLFLAASLVIAALVLLSFPQMFFEPLTLLVRITDQVLLAMGLAGSALRNKPLRFAGWVGIALFFVYAVFGSLPSVDHPAFDSNGLQRLESWIWRPVLALASYVVLVVCYRKLAFKPQPR